MMNLSKKNMVKMFNQFSIKHRLTDVFYDFVHVAAIAISNAIDFKNFKNREKQYFEVMKKYSHEEQVLLSDIFGELTRTIEEEPGDVLGELYMELGLGNSGTGQFFTPYHVSVLASKVTFDKDKIKKTIKENGYITLNEPTCGSAGMIIAFSQCMKDAGLNPQRELKVVCQDLDIRCVYMSYIQLSLLGIPANVLHCNTLSLEVFDSWVTPFYILQGFGRM